MYNRQQQDKFCQIEGVIDFIIRYMATFTSLEDRIKTLKGDKVITLVHHTMRDAMVEYMGKYDPDWQEKKEPEK